MLFPLQRNMSRLWILLHLLWLSAEDIRDQELSMFPIMVLGISGLVRAVAAGGRVEWIPGICLLALGAVTGERIGYGDGWLVLALGAWLERLELLRILGIGFLFWILFGTLTGKKEIPLVTFLTGAYLIGGCL